MAVLKGATGLPERGPTKTSETSDEEIKGTKVFVATEVEDIGWRKNLFDRKPDAPPYRALVVRGFIAHKDRAVPISNDEKISGAPKSNCIGYITAVRGGSAPDKDEEVDFGEIVGKAIQVTVSSRARSSGGGYWLSMKQPTALMDGMTVPACLREYLTDNWTPFRWMAEDALERQHAQLVGATTGSAEEHPNAPTERRGGAEQPAPPHDGKAAMQWPGHAFVTKETWSGVAPVLRQLVDRFFDGSLVEMRGQFERMLKEFREQDSSDGIERVERVLEWVTVNEDGDVKFSVKERTDQDAIYFRDDLVALGQFLEIAGEQTTEDDGLVDPDDLPF